MVHIAVIGAGITGVTSAYSLISRGIEATVFDRHRYPAMETSFANGGQLSASNAEVWTNPATILKGLKWLLKKDAPLLISLKPSWKKYSWMAEFLAATRHYEKNTSDTVKLALLAREQLFEIARKEAIEFNHEKCGILHFYRDNQSYLAADKVNQLLSGAGLERHAVSPSQINELEPALDGKFVGGFYTKGDSTGDIHKFTRALSEVCKKRGVVFRQQASVRQIQAKSDAIEISYTSSDDGGDISTQRFDGVLICAGVESPRFASQLGDRFNLYPVKGYSITVHVADDAPRDHAPWISLLDEDAKIVTSRLGAGRYRVAGTAEINGYNRDIRSDRIEPLVKWVEQCHPKLDTSQYTPWAGLRPMMPDMMPWVKKGKRSRVYYNTGHGHLGWTLSAATAEIVANIVEQDFSGLFDPVSSHVA